SASARRARRREIRRAPCSCCRRRRPAASSCLYGSLVPPMRGFLTLVFASSLAIGCGGSSEGPPKPLERHFDEMYIAAIPVDQQKASFDAQHEWTVARAEDAKANADLNEANMQLGIARNDAKPSHPAAENAISAKKTAAQPKDRNRENVTQKNLTTAMK